MVGRDYKARIFSNTEKSYTKSKRELRKAERTLGIIAFSVFVSFFAGVYFGAAWKNEAKEVKAEIEKVKNNKKNNLSAFSPKNVVIKRWLNDIDVYKGYNFDNLPSDKRKGFFIELVRFRNLNNAKITIGFLQSKKFKAFCRIKKGSNKKEEYIILVGPYHKRELAYADALFLRKFSKKFFNNPKIVKF